MSFVDRDDDAECPDVPVVGLGRKLKDPASMPWERFSMRRPICSDEL
jgi:hypothetical protein